MKRLKWAAPKHHLENSRQAMIHEDTMKRLKWAAPKHHLENSRQVATNVSPIKLMLCIFVEMLSSEAA